MKATVKAGFVMAISMAMALSTPAFAHAPTIVELYQSQGCSSCPPAIRNVNAIADRPGVLALTFAVTYWDRLGWKDTFAKPEFTQRQYDYQRGLHNDNVYTPQVVIDGRRDLVGTDAKALQVAVAAAAPLPGPDITLTGDRVTIGSSTTPAAADVWLVRYDPRILKVAIGSGENSGVTIAHRNVVRSLAKLGGWTGKLEHFALPPAQDAVWRTAVLVQNRNGGAILGSGVN